MLLLDRSKCRPALTPRPPKRKRTTFPPSYARNAIAASAGPSGGAAGASVRESIANVGGPGGDHMPGGYCGVIIGGEIKMRWCRRVPSNCSKHTA